MLSQASLQIGKQKVFALERALGGGKRLILIIGVYLLVCLNLTLSCELHLLIRALGR
jgi:hypothetical protein